MARSLMEHQPGRWTADSPGLSLEQRIAELEAVCDAAPIGIFLCDRECRFIRVNRYLTEIDGVSAEPHLGKTPAQMMPGLWPGLEAAFRRVLEHGETVLKVEVEGEVPAAPGVLRYWEASLHPMHDKEKVVAVCGIIDEITDRKAAEKERAEGQARLQRLLDANLFGVATETREGIIDANDAFLKLVGYSRADLVQRGLDWRKLTPPEHLATKLAALESLERTGIYPGFVKEFIRKDGQRVPVLSGAALLDRKPLRWIAFAIDLTDQKAGEARARALMLEMTHRTKNILAVVSALAHQIARTSSSLEMFRDRFTARLRALAAVHDMLVRDDWQGAAVDDLVRSQLAHCGELAEGRIRLNGPPVSLCATASQYIGMALYELSTNALKYGALSGETGTVAVRWAVQPAGRPETFTLEWIEEGGPPVDPPKHQGYGYTVTTKLVADALDAKASADFRKEGLRWSFVMPSTFLGATARQEDGA